ncbi:MAG: helix-turn-helix transcriptional regulator [Clostridia bacterium]|nr:helix-turn-helix transcriptional regulator [Clostridia bacterium]
MENKTAVSMETVIEYIESHLDSKLELDTIAEAVHYSKYHLHRLFTATTGLTIHDYVQRRQLTEAAKLLVFSEKPVIEIAFICGYESQQAFSSAFKAMYKLPPAEYREKRVFYPLQLRFRLSRHAAAKSFTKADIHPAERADLPDWMKLMRLVIDGYPALDETEYQHAITRCIDNNQALVLRDGKLLVGAMAFSANAGCIDFLGIHPQYRRHSLQKLFLDVLLERFLPDQEICMTTYRQGDKADTGYREMLRQLGFAERELLVEFGYPTQRFVLPIRSKKEIKDK